MNLIPTVLILIDGFRYDYISIHRSKILNIIENSGLKVNYTDIEETLGFITRPAFLAGLYPEESNLFSMFYLNMNKSPFRILNFIPMEILKLLSFSSRVEHRIRNYFVKRIKKTSNTAEKYYASTINIPLELLKFFDFSEKEFPDGSYNGHPTIFNILKEKGFRYLYFGFPYISLPTYEEDIRILNMFKKWINRDIILTFLQFSSLDMLGHTYGPYSNEVRIGMANIDEIIREVVVCCNRIYKDGYNLVIFGDHGMVEVKRTVDLWNKLNNIPLKIGKDYLIFLDSSIARFWFFKEKSKDIILEFLLNISEGKILDNTDLERYRIRFNDNRYGDLLFLLKPGNIIYPNFFQFAGQIPSGMHGYIPEFNENKAGLIIGTTSEWKFPELNKNFSLVDLFSMTIKLIGIDKKKKKNV